MPSIPIPQLKFGKRKVRSQMCVLLTEDGRWDEKEYPVAHGVIEDEQAGLKWLIMPDNQYLADDGYWYQILTEMSQVPLCPRNPSFLTDGKNDDKELGEIANELFGITFEDKKTEQFLKAGQSVVWDKIMWIVSIVCGSMIIFAAIRWFAGG